MKIHKNEGTIDRIIRIGLGGAIMLWGIASGSWLGIIGLPIVGTGIIGWCGLYDVLGISTCPVKKKNATK